MDADLLTLDRKLPGAAADRAVKLDAGEVRESRAAYRLEPWITWNGAAQYLAAAREATRQRAEMPCGAAVLDTVRTCYADFRLRLAQVGELWTCNCTACARATGLDLKFVVNAGRYVLQQIAGSRELTGPDVVMAHRLLMNGAADEVGHGAYALFTEAAVRQCSVPTEGAMPMTETYEHYSPISAFAFALR